MPGQPTSGQIALLVVSIAFFAAGGAVSLGRLWWDRAAMRIGTRVCMYGGLVTAIGVVAWHAAARGRWIPIEDNFDALVWLAILLALFVVYTQRTRPLRGLDWFVMPIVILLLLGAGHFGTRDYHEYLYENNAHKAWLWVHSATAYGGAVAFAVAAACGAMFLVGSRRLRRKQSAPWFGNLERLEHMTMAAVVLGFALLTVGMVTGVVRWLNGTHVPVGKITLSSLAWLAYAIVLHAPINPRFRGRKAAMLSIFGFALMIATLVAVQIVGASKL